MKKTNEISIVRLKQNDGMYIQVLDVLYFLEKKSAINFLIENGYTKSDEYSKKNISNWNKDVEYIASIEQAKLQ